MSDPTPSEMFAFKVLTRDQWDQLRTDGSFAGAPVDLADGYIHLSTRAQVIETVTRHFAGQDNLVLAMVDLAALGDALKWEPSRGGALFPHYYGVLEKGMVTTSAKLRLGRDGAHVFPAGFDAG